MQRLFYLSLIIALILYSPAFLKAQLLLDARGNEGLNCIVVDNPSTSAIASGWKIDANSTYSEDCIITALFPNNVYRFEILNNPANGVLVIRADEVAAMTLFNAKGELVLRKYPLSAGINDYDIAHLRSGLYYIHIQSVNNYVTERLFFNE